MHITIIDVDSGNLRSVAKAFERVVREHNMKAGIRVTNRAADLADASHIVLPGVGAFGRCARTLSALPGMIATLEEEVTGRKKPFLGICVGMQLMMERSFEHGKHEGLGWIKGEGAGGSPSDPALKIPHTGWNALSLRTRHPAFDNIKSGAHAYFVHSYHARCKDASDCLAETDHGGGVTAAIGRDNLLGVQFHPEKSQETGLALLGNFLMMGGA